MDHRGRSGGDAAISGYASEERGDAVHESGAAPPMDAAAGRLGVLIPGERLDPSLADPEAWLRGLGWHARIYPAMECAARYGRVLEPEVAAAATELWVATATLGG